jgi:hypothetical protein
MNTLRILTSALFVLLLCGAVPVSAGLITQVNDISDLNLDNVFQAVSFRGDAQDDTLISDPTVTFIGVANGVPKAGVTLNASSGHANMATFPTITGGVPNDPAKLAYVYGGQLAFGATVDIDVALPNGSYEVQLLLGDGFLPGANRIADISVEGLLTDNYSYSSAQLGSNANGGMLTENVFVIDGNLDISLTQDGGNGGPHISGLIISEVSAIPEPSTFVLCSLGLMGLGLFRRRRASRGWPQLSSLTQGENENLPY